MPRFLLPVCFLIPTLGFCAAGTSHLDLRRDAEAAFHRKDYATARDGFAAALQKRPDSPRYLHNLAAVSALMGDAGAALGWLQKLAALGVATPVERDPSFAALQGTPEFLRVTRQLAENRAEKGAATVFAELPGRIGILEGIACRERTGEVFLGDVHTRCIWRRERGGQLTRFTAEDDALLGIFGLAIDEPRNALWAAMTALPEMNGYTADLKGVAALAEFNLATGELRQVVPVPADGRAHGLGDVVVAKDGTVYATDSMAPVIWRFSPADEEMVKLAESPEFVSLQGMILTEKTLLVADYGNGLFAVDLSAGEHGRPVEQSIRPFAPPENTTLLGLDGLVAIGGEIVATQNGVTPQRVVQISLSPDRQSVASLTVLASATAHLDDLTLVTLVDGQPTFLAGAGWKGFDPAKAPEPLPHTVRIMQVALP